MRSRYSAFVLGLPDYLLASWHASTRPATLTLDARVQWLGLQIKASHSTGPGIATVEFVARSRLGGSSAQRLHEVSHFVCEQAQWFYVDGELR